MRRKERAKRRRSSHTIRCYFEFLFQMNYFVSVNFEGPRKMLTLLKKTFLMT